MTQGKNNRQNAPSMGLRNFLIALALFAVLVSPGCGKKAAAPPSTGQQATVVLKDGTSFAGTVSKSSTAEITLTAANGESRTYPMSQVDSVQYGNGSSTTASTTPPAGTPANTPPPTAAPVAGSTPSNPPSTLPPAASTSPATTPSPVATAPNPALSQPAPPQQSAPGPTRQPVVSQRRSEPAESVVRVVPAGTSLAVRNNETIDSKTASPGQTYSAVISRDVLDSRGRVLIPSGSNASLIVRSSTAQGKIQGQSELALDLETVSVAGRRYRVETTDIVQAGRAGVGRNKRTAGFIGGGTVLGTLLGAVAGGGKGAAIGAISGAAAGTATQAITRGHGVRVPAETLLTFRLEAPIRIREVR